MKSSSKQRIVGAFVLISLALIFFPVVFDLEQQTTIDTTPRIPPMPEYEPVDVAEPERVEGIVPPKPMEEAFVPEDAQTPELETVSTDDNEAPPAISEEADTADSDATSDAPANDTQPVPPKLTEQGIPEAWVIQVGSFKDSTKAEELNAALIADGYKSYIREVTVAGAPMKRVFVGPKIRKSNALEEKAAIDKKYGIEAIVLKFQP
ncbi:MAG: SPOR domain-containing protein [bacterium]